MNCSSCGRENPDRAKFCMECAAPLTRQCAHCGSELPSDAKFCVECAAPAAARLTQDRDPRAYTPKHLAHKILTSRSALEGERKQVTVLFADVRASAALAEPLDPEEWHRILERFLLILAEGVHRFEGTVNQYLGDGIMALFGAPIAHEDHAQRACYAALHLRDPLRLYADELRVERGVSFGTCIGLNSGEVVVGKIGEDLRMDYTAQGHTVNLAQRMEELAETGHTYLTEHTARRVEGFFRLRDLGPSQLRGMAERVGVCDLEGVGALRTRLDVSRARGFSRFVGRVDEMATLEGAMSRAQQGDGQVVGVVGQAGVGKSRLCLQFVEQCRASGIRVLEAHCPAHGKTVPLLPILELLRDAFGITAEDTDQAAREKIAGRLVLVDRAFDDVLRLVFDFLGVSDPETPAPPMDPEARQRQLYGFLRRLVQARSEREPAILLFDDIQWIDEGSDAYLAQLVEATSGTRTLLLANFRPEYRAEWMGKSDYQQLPLSPLGPEAIHELLHDLLGSDPTVAGLHDLIRERTGGNPFFIEEVVQSLAESESLSGTRGAYRLVTPIEELAIPATVQAVLAARIDRLPEREKHVLQTAAVATVVDKRFSESILGRVAGLPGPDLAAALSRLQADELIVEEALYPEREYVFKHPLTQSVAYDTQLSDRRSKIHAALARALVEIHAEKPEEHAALIAHHWEQAGEALEAARWHRRAAEWLSVSAATQRQRHWNSVLSLLRDVPDSPEVTALELLARVRLLTDEWLGGSLSLEEARRLSEEGQRLAERAGDLRSLIMLHRSYASSGMDKGEPVDRVEPALQKAAQIADELGDPDLRLLTQFGSYALASFVQDDLQKTLEVGSGILREFEPSLELGRDEFLGLSPYLFTQLLTALNLGRLGRIDDGFAELERALDLAGGDRVYAGWVLMFRSWLERLRGNTDTALDAALESLRTSMDVGGATNRISSLVQVGLARGLSGNWQESARALADALQLAGERQVCRMFEASMLAGLSEAQLGMGDVEAACRSAESAIAIARERGYVGQEVEAQLAIASAIRQRDGREGRAAIEAALDRAAERTETTGYRAVAPRVEIERADLARLLGDEATCHRHLREAHRLFSEMGATGHAERVARELAELQR